MAVEVTRPQQDHAKHRRKRRGTVVSAAMAAGAVGAAAVGVVTVVRAQDSAAAGCTTDQALRVSAAREIAPAVARVADTDRSLRCLRIVVASDDPADVAATLSARARPDVWIPDSSAWLSSMRWPSGKQPVSSSIARSPVVLALPTAATRRSDAPASFEGIARTATTPHPVRLVVAPLERSAVAQAALVELRGSLQSTPANRGALSALLRSMDTRSSALDGSSSSSPRLATDADGELVARATTEQAVWAANDEGSRFTAVYPPSAGVTMDYPFAVLAADASIRSAADRLSAALRREAGRRALSALGFRTAGARVPSRHVAVAGSLLTAERGVDGEASPGAPLTAAGARAARQTMAILRRPSRVLALVDVSGSMAAQVPGTDGSSRIELARKAINRTLPLFAPGSAAALWRFSANLTPSTDYEQIVSPTALNAQSRQRFRAAVDGLTAVPDGGTGLYSSILGAFRYARAGYDPRRVNSVVVLSDGRDEHAAAHRVGLRALLHAIDAEQDPRRPVAVIAIAYGPDADAAALRAITATSGGILYTSEDPRDLPVIFHEAIGHRLCGGTC
jgi:Ca-activated chloride channel family protein